MEAEHLSTEPRIVYMIKPPNNSYKLNVDGEVKVSSSGCGGLIRDGYGNNIMAFVGLVHYCSVNFAELSAILHGIKLCVSLGISNISIEVDSTFNIHCLSNVDDIMCNQDLFYLVRDIKQLLIFVNYSLSHVYREGNAYAN
ncbi:uncharacterized protein LOC110109872 [Dendrobium catenatum]|uniref:uncharacterized protein LOC110109872 n=1 Tax=Dendrobium catenatum TaxID=906689 RepID=UPI0009F4C0E7|nr:uncharacterized protein LOC110109872 [Dendrobium catenatum]